MSSNSNIEWTEATWNPIAGCTPNSPGCLNCYAATMSHRLDAMGQAKYSGLTVLRNGVRTFNGNISFDEGALTVPLKRRKPTMYFVNSMSDLFHEDVPFDYVDKVFAVMALTRRHTFQVLTKRPKRMAEYTARTGRSIGFLEKAARELGYTLQFNGIGLVPFPLRNVWLGCSPVNQQTFNAYALPIMASNASTRFLSLEPLLGPVDMTNVGDERWDLTHGWKANAANEVGWANTSRIDWVIVGGESGPNARPCDIAWIRGIVARCQRAELPVFVKQIGSKPFTTEQPSDPAKRFPNPGHWDSGTFWPALKDKKGGDPSEWPEDLRVRQMPKMGAA